MNRYKEIAQQYNRTLEQGQELDLEYDNKKKGDAYIKRKMQLQDKLKGLKKKAKSIGTTGNIVHIYGKRSRPNRKNPQVMVQERFNLYFVNVDPEEVSALVNLHVTNADNYQITFIRPGQLISS